VSTIESDSTLTSDVASGVDDAKAATTGRWDLLVDRDRPARTQLVVLEDAEPHLADGEVEVAVERFGLTANNVTYAVLGNAWRYYDHFPSPLPGLARVPVWGFARVTASAHPDVVEGERLYGFWPMSTHTVLAPTDVTDVTLADGSPHRADLPAVYTRYQRCAADPLHAPDTADLEALLRPLFLTAWLLADDLRARLDAVRGDGPGRVVLTSASSKTAIATAHLLTAGGGIEVVGVTSSDNVGFVMGNEAYDLALAYREVEVLPVGVPTVVADVAGNGGVVVDLHDHLGDTAVASLLVGASHGRMPDLPANLAGPAPELFSAPAIAARRQGQLDPAALAAGWRGFLEVAAEWIDVVHGSGPEAVARVWRDLNDEGVGPREGNVLVP
jgi:NADPH:quinone reductase-like Zn-dependent oxidoreductase